MNAQARLQVAGMLVGPVFGLLAVVVIIGPLAWSIMADHWMLGSAMVGIGLHKVIGACRPLGDALRLAREPRSKTDKKGGDHADQ